MSLVRHLHKTPYYLASSAASTPSPHLPCYSHMLSLTPQSSATMRCRCAARAGPDCVALCRRCRPKDVSATWRVRCLNALRDQRRHTRVVQTIRTAVSVVVCFRVLPLCHLRSSRLPLPKLALVPPPSCPHAAVCCAPVASGTPSCSSPAIVFQRVIAVQGEGFLQCLEDHGATCPAPASGQENEPETSQQCNGRRSQL